MVVAPVEEPVTLAEMKAHLRVDQVEEDALTDSDIRSAREYAELLSRRTFITTTLAIDLDAWPDGDIIELKQPPIQSVESIAYVDADGAAQVLDPALYWVQPSYERVRLAFNATWPEIAPGSIITVTYVAGYGDTPEHVPARYGQAIRLLGAQWFEHREAVSDLRLMEPAHSVMALLMMDRAY